MNNYRRVVAAIVCRNCNGDGRVIKDVEELERIGWTTGKPCGECEGTGLNPGLAGSYLECFQDLMVCRGDWIEREPTVEELLEAAADKIDEIEERSPIQIEGLSGVGVANVLRRIAML
jgi:hypothetical protein